MKNRLKALRNARGWSQAVLGEHLDVSRQSVNAIEAGRYDPSLPLAFKIARLFEEPIEEIFDDCAGGVVCDGRRGVDPVGVQPMKRAQRHGEN